MKKGYFLTAYVLIAFWAGYEAHTNKVFPIGRFVERTFFTLNPEYLGWRAKTFFAEKTAVTETQIKTQKELNVFADTAAKKEVKCPKEEMAYVLIGFGQSNSANYAGHRSKATSSIVNFFNGKCYSAVDPMLGATGRYGSVWIPIAERLALEDKTVVLVTFGVASSRIDDWLDTNFLMPFYKENIGTLKQFYSEPDSVVWFQGTSDRATPKINFERSLAEWLSIIKSDLPKAQLYVVGNSYCHGENDKDLLAIQKKVASEIGGRFIGPTDLFNSINYRYDDCHFSEQGVMRVAEMIASKMAR